MTDQIPDPMPQATPIPPKPSGPGPSEAWDRVVASMAELGDAIAAWTRSAADDPQNRQRLDQVKAGVDDLGKKADSAFEQVKGSDFGQQVSEGAQQAGQAIGDAAQQVQQTAAPHVASAFSGLADMFGKAAAKVDEAVSRDRAPSAPAAEPPSPPASAPAPEDPQQR